MTLMLENAFIWANWSAEFTLENIRTTGQDYSFCLWSRGSVFLQDYWKGSIGHILTAKMYLWLDAEGSGKGTLCMKCKQMNTYEK